MSSESFFWVAGKHAVAYHDSVLADTPKAPDDETPRGRHTKRRRRPAVGAEAARRAEFGRTFGAANSEAGRKVREERNQ
jgi:hypothetical protein